MDFINLKTLTIDELTGVVNLYPWYGGARKELCLRMASSGGEGWGGEQFADAAMYVVDRRIIYDIFRKEKESDWSDRDMEKIVRSYIQEEPSSSDSGKEGERSVRVVGGDYFSQAQYDSVKRSDDNVFSRFAANVKSERESSGSESLDGIFCTETLAQIYAEQGYYSQAKKIYSRLLLNFPEKNAYFASLINKLEEIESETVSKH